MTDLGTPQHWRAKKANAIRNGNDEAAAAADHGLRAANLAKAIQTAIDADPPLTPEQRLSLTALLTGPAPTR